LATYSYRTLRELIGVVYAANKLKIPNFKFRENLMNLRLAAQTLSKSVSDGLLFCENLNLLTNIRGTATFCSMFNDAFVVLNCRRKLRKGNSNYSLKKITFSSLHNF